jgi:hypothetical protein
VAHVVRRSIAGLGALAAATCTASLVGLAAPAGAAAADEDQVAAYRGPRYAATGGHGDLQVSTPTFDKSQAKSWWYDGSWWALLYQPADATVRVGQLQHDHRWVLGGPAVSVDPVAVGDVVVDGRRVHVLSRDRTGLSVVDLVYRRGAGRYAVAAPATALGTRGTSAATMAQDSTGRLWVTFVRASHLTVLHSNPSRTRWSLPYVPDVAGSRVGRSELTDVVSANGSVVVIWSDQRSGAFHAATHQDGDPDSLWATETAAEGDHIADDHISAHVVPGKAGDTVLVAVKTSLNDYRDPVRDDPLILLLARTPDGTWSQHVVASVADGWTRPVVTADASGRVFVVGRRAGSIVYKAATIADLTFEAGPGRHLLTFAGASFTDPSVGTQTVDVGTGLLVLASDERDLRYWHAELALGGRSRSASAADPPDRSAPSAPSRVTGIAADGSVRLSWSPATDGAAWSPAGVSPGVSYQVFRDGQQLGRTSSTFYVVTGRADGDFTVSALDLAGNRSPAVAARLVASRTEGTGRGLTVVLVLGAALAAASVVGGVYVHLRRQVRRTAHQAQRIFVEAPLTVLVPAPRGKHARR